ncbi:uncharacterized protein LOC132750994 isoform X1 [Ruditapes philippinarum]|uniref:uncharacterized protein LOC132750994 isoform X1 n=1 Tax=Ruditapes philippinarum TaxID=129788 RepID=UPI00295A93AF|nr:uncharacterized protein LOC132750994 isoform X1 [Ruditapes philippinarum]
MLKIAHLNVSGWTENNNDLRCAIIKSIDADIFSICETHLTREKVINVDGYVWFGNNRKNIHVNAVRGSGGVGILVKARLFKVFEISIIESSFEGIIALQFKCKHTNYCSMVISAYLPPENSVWGRDAQTFFAHILSIIYLNSEYDTIFLAVDFNARIGTLSDILQSVDSLPERKPIDNCINQHGREFIDFLIDSKFCTLNSRFENDAFTSISPKGKSVVDYICVPHDVFQKCIMFKILSMQCIIDEYELHEYIGDRSYLPDHSALLTHISLNCDYCIPQNGQLDNNTNTPSQLRYKLNLIPDNFMDRDIAKRALLEIIESIESSRESQEEIDSLYNKLCETITNEMNHSIPRYNASRRTSKRNKNAKPYWNEALTEKWNQMHLADSSIPMEIVNEHGRIDKDENAVFDKWKRDFENLYNSTGSDEFDSEFYNRAKLHKHILIEMSISDPLYAPKELLNNNISIEEIVNVVMSAKSKSACGIDNLLYAVLKFPPVIAVLHKLFQLIFDTSVIPSDWRKAIICPILKDKSSDKRLPLNYRGVSLLSCVGKLYSSLINKRITFYLENENLLADEQNGFRRGRSCEDHIFIYILFISTSE